MQIEVKWQGNEVIVTCTEVKRKWLIGPSYTIVRKFRGSGTVWHDAESGIRQNTFTEKKLNEIYKKAKWAQDNFIQTFLRGSVATNEN